MTDRFASLCFLSYNRPAFVIDAIMTASRNANFPHEIIVHDDGSSDLGARTGLLNLLDAGYISHLILNPAGHNEGVGEAIRRMFAVAQGDVLIKLDQDMLFNPGWLKGTMDILDADPAIGMFGFFKYHHEPVDWRKMRIHVDTRGDELRRSGDGDLPGYHYTRQFCGSGFAIPRRVYDRLGPIDSHLDAFNEDSNFMARVRESWVDEFPGAETCSADVPRMELALPNEDMATNRGFGIGPSTVVEEGYAVHKINHVPYVIQAFGVRQGESGPKTVDSQRDTGVDMEVGAASDGESSPRKFDVGVVITTCAGREENLQRALDYVGALTRKPAGVVIVYDGCWPESPPRTHAGPTPIWHCPIPKHAPGQEQPRNVGARELRTAFPGCNYVWFLDSDLIVPSDTLEHFYQGLLAAPEERILIGPYDWLAPGLTGFIPEMKDMTREVAAAGRYGMPDYRWEMLKANGPERVFVRDLGCALACFSGNLIWPLDEFERVGGFHIELHHGRCEDGELGLRAMEHGIPMSLVRDARGWHVWHPINTPAILEKNKRDVALLNRMHPWVENEGLIVVDKDGKRFDWKCPDCGDVVNSLDFWPHAQSHHRSDT